MLARIKEKEHLIELPRRVLIGYNILKRLGEFILKLEDVRSAAIVTGPNIIKRLGNICEESLRDADIKSSWLIAEDATKDTVLALEKEVNADLLIGFGGGKSVDVAKSIAYNLDKPFISVPTSASHDGIASPFASIRGANKHYSLITRMPIGILADIKLISEAPRRLLASGCGDLLAKITAVKDWELARDENDEYFGNYSANLASLSATIIMKEAKNITDYIEYTRTVVEALISSGVAAGIAGSSRPCSGSEHLFSHALEHIAPNKGLHGERCGLGAMMMAKLHGLDWKKIRDTLNIIKAPATASEIGVNKDEVIKALMIAKDIRPDRYTILHKINMDENKAYELAKSTMII